MNTPTATPPGASPLPLPTDADSPEHDGLTITDQEATRQAHDQQVGERPGSLTIRPGALKPRLFLISYNDDTVYEHEYTDRYPELHAYLQGHPELKHWVDVRGYGDLAVIKQLMRDFHIHPLQMEDVLNDYQRSKVEVLDDGRLFIVSRMTDFTQLREIDDDQLSIFTGPNYVLSFQDDYDDCLEVLRQRIRTNLSQTRRKPSLYLAYALNDVVLDNYFPTMAAIGDYLERLEERIFAERRERRLLNRILRMKKDIVRFRRLVYPERDKITEVLRLPDDLMPADLKQFWRDSYDHAVQALDLADSYRESVSSLTELYYSEQSNRMNEVMKVLTIISAIFIPLSFVVGLYGMNFQRENPDGSINYLNMPELYHPLGYPFVLLSLGLVVVGQVYYFWRKGWLTSP